MKNQNFLPEARNPLTVLDPFVNPKSYIGKVVSCSPTRYDYSTNEMEVFIGNSFYGIIPLSELSIYSLENVNCKTLAQFFTFPRLLTAEITGYFGDTNRFLLSRKKNMENALLYFSSLEGSSETIYAHKTGATGSNVFVDIGAGIYGMLPYKEVSSSYVNSLNYFDGVDYIPIHILFQNVYGKFIVSYRSTIPYQNFEVGDIVSGRVVGPVKDLSGLFIELNPNQAGILNADFGLHIAHCDDDDREWFVVLNENNNFPSRIIRKNGTYLFSIRAIRDDPSQFKLSFVQ